MAPYGIEETTHGALCHPSGVPFSSHAGARASQRHFNRMEVDYVLAHGRMVRRTGIRFYFLGARDVPACDRKLDWVQRLIASTVLVASDGSDVITLYKNGESLTSIRRKSKYRR